MWSVFSVVAFLSIFDSVLTTQNGNNETAQNQTGLDFTGTGVTFARNLSASISVSDTGDLLSDKAKNTTETLPVLEPKSTSIEDRSNVIEFNVPPDRKNDTGNIKGKKFDNFRPSPPLETYFEYNKFPVKPAFAEAKTALNSGPITSFIKNKSSFHRGETFQPSDLEKPRNYEPSGLSSAFGNKHTIPASPPLVWQTKQDNPGDTPWVSRVRFPSTAPATPNHPYTFQMNPVCCNSQAPEQPAQTQHFGYNVQTSQKSDQYLPPIVEHKPVNEYLPSEPHQVPPPSHGFTSTGRGEEFNFNKLVEVPRKHQHYSEGHAYVEPTYNLMEKPPQEIHQKTYGGGYNPWKKILKLFATFIPIGILLSALTPSVITITNVNDTEQQTSRYRSSNASKKDLKNHILSSLDYFEKLNENGCEYRVFCELLVSATNTEDSEKHVQNLLDNFAKQEIDYKSKAEELKKVFEAVRNEDCESITCEFIKNPT